MRQILAVFGSVVLLITLATLAAPPAPAAPAASAEPVAALAGTPLSSPSALPQQWSTEEQALLDHIAMCWDAWLEGVQAGDAGVWTSQCPVAEDYSMWWTEYGAPAGMRMDQRYWMKRDLDEDWLDIRPVAVKIWDNVAMVQFYGYWLARTPEGPTISEYKRTEVFRRTDNGWMFLGGQGTPATAADAEPYK